MRLLGTYFSKGALNAATKSLASEYARSSIRFNAIAAICKWTVKAGWGRIANISIDNHNENVWESQTTQDTIEAEIAADLD